MDVHTSVATHQEATIVFASMDLGETLEITA